MLQISNLKVSLRDEKKEILHNVNLAINPGEIHILQGKNGSGKSSLVSTIMGHPNYIIDSGEIKLANEDYSDFIIEKSEIEDRENILINELEPFQRSLLGIFLANQYPVEIPGVGLRNYLRLIYNARRPENEQLPVFKFKNVLEEKLKVINYPEKLITRNLNEGFSGGEKKKTEILQMLVLEPKYVLLDEIDSGLDRESVKEVFEGLREFKNNYPQTSFIIITHYDRAQEYLKPDFVHEMQEGELG